MPADQIDGQIARYKDRQLALHLEPVPQGRAYPRHQFGHTEWLADVVIGPEVERLDLRPLVIARRQDHDRDG